MEEEFKIQKLRVQYSQFFEQFSDEFLDFIFSGRFPSLINQICHENGVEDEEKIEKIAYRITLVLFEQIPKENLTEVLINGANLDPETARKISLRAEELIFSKAPKIKLKETPKEKPVITTTAELERRLRIEKEKEKLKEEKKEPPKPIQRDIYREPIE